MSTSRAIERIQHSKLLRLAPGIWEVRRSRLLDRATLLKELGYAPGQFGKIHLGDLIRFPPPMRGFDDTRPALRLLVVHDDAVREFDDQNVVGHAIARPSDKGWSTISIENDWNRVFSD
jgi:hypothetical protein